MKFLDFLFWAQDSLWLPSTSRGSSPWHKLWIHLSHGEPLFVFVTPHISYQLCLHSQNLPTYYNVEFEKEKPLVWYEKYSILYELNYWLNHRHTTLSSSSLTLTILTQYQLQQFVALLQLFLYSPEHYYVYKISLNYCFNDGAKFCFRALNLPLQKESILHYQIMCSAFWMRRW